MSPTVNKIIDEFKNIGGNYNPHKPTFALIGRGKRSSIAQKNMAITFGGRKTMLL